mmetsp:Transcript_20554/g.28323  ORF Transcript_20554/g.28323 Transcript_20554/m.28323 type:complete len:818 (-) Transcript_20554:135-2588(-)
MDINVQVAVRCRPMSSKETSRGCVNIINIGKTPTSKVFNTVHVKSVPGTGTGNSGGGEDKDFTFDYCYDAESTQSQVYNDLGQPIVSKALDGFNGTIFAYGQTGSGKTFSMMGTEESKGIIPQLNDDLWTRLIAKREALLEEKNGVSNGVSSKQKPSTNTTAKFMVTVSFLEVYNEDIKDLLNPSEKKLKIHESPDQGIFVEGLCELIVRDSKELLRLIYQGNAVRRVASTNMNDQSSRSHSVFTIKIEQRTSTAIENGLTKEHMIKAKMNLVDLAGSERADKTGASGATLKEGANINLSLMTLGNVINALAEGSNAKKGAPKKVIPYRNSKLTRLLQESLGGNSATVMIASISPADYNYLETVGTLKYANRAKSIANAVTRNEDSNERLIRELQMQIEQLKLKLLAEGNNTSQNQEIPNLEIERKLKEMEQSQQAAWEEKERLSKALEEERQANMNTVIGQMMQNVKDEKVQHMKNIKRLTNEKALLAKTFREAKDQGAQLKQQLDENINTYQLLQKKYDDLAADEHSDPASQEEAERMANEMIQLLTSIESDRLLYTEKRDLLRKTKDRMEKVELEITDERAELVTTAGLLSQNDKIREQIQQEEREKMKVELEKALKNARQKLAEERESVQGTLREEVQGELDAVRSEAQQYKQLLSIEETKNSELMLRHKQLQEYADSLESRLADSEVAQEFSQTEVDRLQKELATREQTIENLGAEITQAESAYSQLEQKSAAEVVRLQEQAQQEQERVRFEMFKSLMDGFLEERTKADHDKKQLQLLLAQATKDIAYLTSKNQELQTTINQIVYAEPPIRS